MPSGAVVTYSVTASDNVGVQSVACDRASGSVFPIGYSSVTCVARDAAGNTTSHTFGVEVIGAQEQMGSLITWVRAQGYSSGTENPLVNQLRAAMGDNASAQKCTKLDDFIHMVAVKRGEIPIASATYMVSAATNIESVLGCSH